MIDSSWMLASLVAKVEEGRYISIVQGNSPVDRNRNRREKKRPIEIKLQRRARGNFYNETSSFHIFVGKKTSDFVSFFAPKKVCPGEMQLGNGRRP